MVGCGGSSMGLGDGGGGWSIFKIRDEVGGRVIVTLVLKLG